ncbi:MAG: peptidase M3, partial [Muribaculaceae bacterium]|nr:peptidase M3 [Muribaculaceae bacterium]
AVHYKTGEKMPEELLEKFIQASQYGAAYACIRQLNFGITDMAYHTIEEPLSDDTDIEMFENVAITPVRIFAPVEGTYFSPTFSHVFAGGYAAGYYGYKWSEELDADAFDAFLENGIFDLATADKFLHMLQAGGTEDPMTLYIEFRGKKPTVDALLKRDGIVRK